MENRYDYDVRVTYKDGGFESMCVNRQMDSAAALIAAMKIVRRKQRSGRSTCKDVAGVTVVLASHESYRKEGAK